ncbi:MAG: hypothetical protein V4534_08670 [Myxococcota bacterium]
MKKSLVLFSFLISAVSFAEVEPKIGGKGQLFRAAESVSDQIKKSQIAVAKAEEALAKAKKKLTQAKNEQPVQEAEEALAKAEAALEKAQNKAMQVKSEAEAFLATNPALVKMVKEALEANPTNYASDDINVAELQQDGAPEVEVKLDKPADELHDAPQASTEGDL